MVIDSPCLQSRAKGKVALDLGTTSLSGVLIDLSGQVVARAQIRNPQQDFGADVLTRLKRASGGEAQVLQTLLVDGLKRLIDELLAQAEMCCDDIASVAAAGNPGITCLLTSASVEGLLFPPHKPPFTHLLNIPPTEIDLGLSCPLQVFPLVSGFVGGDLVAAVYAAECNRRPKTDTARNVQKTAAGHLIIDIGTNAELALWDGQWWWATSAAAGPAFEGEEIEAGMVYAAGAVSEVQLRDDHLKLSVVGGGEPRGVCASGLVSLVAAALEGGLIDASGRIVAPAEVPTNLRRYLVKHGSAWNIRFHRSAHGDLLLSQQDVRCLQLAKGAIHAGVAVLCEKTGLQPESICQVVLTGALGTGLSVAPLKRVAFLPEPMLDKTSLVANRVLAGLKAYLVSPDGQNQLEDLVKSIRIFPLSGTPAFETRFLSALSF